MKVIWKTDAFLKSLCSKELKFSNGWIVGVRTSQGVIWLNERITQTKHPICKEFYVLLHEFLHSLQIKPLSAFIDWLVWLKNWSIIMKIKREN